MTHRASTLADRRARKTGPTQRAVNYIRDSILVLMQLAALIVAVICMFLIVVTLVALGSVWVLVTAPLRLTWKYIIHPIAVAVATSKSRE
jgi:hypothetical protein